jgi:hypothetical protein
VGRAGARLERDLAAFAAAVEAALGDALLCLVVHGSAAGDDWVPGRSDVNTAVVVPRVTLGVLEALAPVAARWRRRGFAVPLVVERDFVGRAADTFPMELADIHHQHRLLAGFDLFATLATDRAALRRECEREARGKLLRLRALFLAAASDARALDDLMVDSVKSFLVLLRHLARLRGHEPGPRYEDALAAGEALLGPLPALRGLLARRGGAASSRVPFGSYLEEVERIVAAVDGLDG